MMTKRQSFLFSLGVHAGIIVALLIAAVILARRPLKFTTMELDLLAPVQAGVEQDEGTDEEPEPEPEIVEREREDPIFNPNNVFDPSKIPDIAEEKFEEYAPGVEPAGPTDGLSPSEMTYYDLIVAEFTRNWEKTKPARGVLGRRVPTVHVVITIRRDGRILDHRITRASGVPAVDSSVREAIRLSKPPPFLRDMKGTQQDFKINFVLER